MPAAAPRSFNGPDPRVIPILRLAFLVGAGLFGGAVGCLQTRGELASDPAMARPLTIAGRVIWIVALGACLFLASRVRNESNARKVFATSLIGWAIAESTAIFGGVYWFVVGNSQWYFSGLGFLALSLLMLPGARRA